MYEYSENFKKQVVKKVLTDGVTQIEVCRKLHISMHSIINWKKRYAEEMKNEVKRIDVESFFIEEEVDIDKLLMAGEPETERTEKETLEKIIAGQKIPSEYTTAEKYAIISVFRKMSEDKIGAALRSCGIQSKHIKLWEDEIIKMGEKRIGTDDYTKRLEDEVKDLKKKLKNSEKEKHELEILIELKKKYSSLFKEEGEE
jgi:transposase-like protein